MYGSGMEYLMDITAFHNKTEMFGIIQNKTIGMTHSMHLQYKKILKLILKSCILGQLHFHSALLPCHRSTVH